MSTVTASEARLKVRFDLSGEAARLKELEDALKRLQEGMKLGIPTPGAKGAANRPEDTKGSGATSSNGQSILMQDVVGKVMARVLNPLETALSAISAIPEVGPLVANSIRVGMDFSEHGAPLIQGFAREVMKSKGIDPDSTAGKILLSTLAGMKGATDSMAALRAKNDSIGPTWEAVKKMALAEALLGGTPGSKDLSEFGSNMFKIIDAQTELSRYVQRKSLEAVGEAGERLFEGMFR